MKTIILDTNFLCHRAFHTTGKLSFRDDPTGVIYGVLRAVIDLTSQLDPDRIVFAFDHGRPLRQDIYPRYKIRRRKEKKQFTRLQKRQYKGMLSQVELLRREILPAIGFKNVFAQLGYEADDVIAKLCMDKKVYDDYIIVACDKDLYQLLDANVCLYNPITHKYFTTEHFKDKYFGIHPIQWTMIKALAGCGSDDIAGIDGVGEITAAKWCAGSIKQGTRIHDLILKNHKLMKENSRLVILPFEGIKRFRLRDDRVTANRWNAVTGKFGLRSLRNQAPILRGTP